MKLPDAQIEHRSANTVTLTLTVPGTHEAFAGHFPGHPILPGVVQLDWAMRLATQHFTLPAYRAEDIRIKFRSIITPDKPLALDLRFDPAKNRLNFCYRDDAVEMSSGQIRLAGAA
ncbi:MAG: hypothetical protein WCD42_00520 [Rhizomicrobium sp.]